MDRFAWLAVAAIAVFAARAEAQSAPLTIACDDAAGRAVSGVQVQSVFIASAKIDRDGRPVIEYDSRSIPGFSPQQRLFVYAHECGHHALGHVRGQSPSAAQEQQADCYGIRTLLRRFGLTIDDVRILQSDMERLGSDQARRLPWSARPYHLDGCLATDTADAGGAAGGRGAGTNADDCVISNDAANAIVDESRDGRTIDGVYVVSNTCPRDVACTFTIQIGTLPNSDIDVGSWMHFRAQKTRTEQHRLTAPTPIRGEPSSGQASPAGVEFRFRETVDSVPPGESVDFRVSATCR